MSGRTPINPGLIFAAAGAVLICMAAIASWRSSWNAMPVANDNATFVRAMIVMLGPGILMFAGGIFCAWMGLFLMRAFGTSTKEVIPRHESALLEELLRQAGDRGVDDYIRLASLSGVTGVFTKLGLTGLPLASIALTLFFTSSALWLNNTDLMDLAKLTLGAFIGSFVQRKSDPEDDVSVMAREVTRLLSREHAAREASKRGSAGDAYVR